MSFVRYYQQPELRDPVVIVAFGGWNDAADAATAAIRFFIERWDPQKVAEIDAEDFFMFTETRPTIKMVEGQRTISWPTNQFLAYVLPEHTHDIIFLIGVEPQLKWKTFSSAFLDVCKRFRVSEVIFLGALLAEVPHSLAVPISGTSSTHEMSERLHEMAIRNSRYEGPTGIIGVLHDTCRQAQIPSVSLWAAAPHYLAATPNVKVTAALLAHINAFLSLGLDLNEIQADAVRFEEQVTALVTRDPEASAYVHRLEEQYAGRASTDEDDENDAKPAGTDWAIGTGPLPSADMLIRDVEELLRKQRENGQQLNDNEENT